MNFEACDTFLKNKPAAVCDWPFGADVNVYKVEGKMFATLSQGERCAEMNLKCDPDEAVALRDIFAAVRPGYHMNKRHWITVSLDRTMPSGELKRLIDNSYRLVIQGLTKAKYRSLVERFGEQAFY